MPLHVAATIRTTQGSHAYGLTFSTAFGIMLRMKAKWSIGGVLWLLWGIANGTSASEWRVALRPEAGQASIYRGADLEPTTSTGALQAIEDPAFTYNDCY